MMFVKYCLALVFLCIFVPYATADVRKSIPDVRRKLNGAPDNDGYGCNNSCNAADVNYVLTATLVKYKIPGSHVAFNQTGDVTFYTRTWMDGGSNSPLCTLNDGNSGLLGPCLQVKPGQTINIKVINEMHPDIGPEPPTPEDWVEAIALRYNNTYFQQHGFHLYNTPVTNTSDLIRDPENEPTSFDNTNLHLHGLQIEPHMYYPQGTSDPLADWITIEPSGDNSCFCYSFSVPKDHLPGTFIYHIHRHGAASVQGWSGMIGYFLVRGGLDDELPAYGVNTQLPFVMWDPHLSTDQGDALRKYRVDEAAQKHLSEQDVATVHSGDTAARSSKRSIAAMSANKMAMNMSNESPEVSSVHVTDFLGGQTDSCDAIPYLVNNEYQPEFTFDVNETVWFRLVCGTTENLCHFRIVDKDEKIISFWNVGSDGITFPKPYERQNLYLGGGMREEVLLRFDTAGDYRIIMLNISTVQYFGTGPDNQLLAHVKVEKGSQPTPVPFTEMTFTSGVPEKDYIQLDEITNRRTIQFGMNTDVTKLPFPQYVINDQPFNHSRIDNTVVQGRVEEWIIFNAELAVHPFHIHVNSFQVKEVESAFEQDNPFTQTVTDFTHPPDRWRDVVLVPPMGFARIWLRYRDDGPEWSGKTVYHCHFLAHEDTGMIANLMIKQAPSRIDLETDEEKAQEKMRKHGEN